MKHTIFTLLLCITFLVGCKQNKNTEDGINTSLKTETEAKNEAKNQETLDQTIKIHAITHGALVLEHNDDVIYIDPYGGINGFKDMPEATMVLITDIHGDHLNTETLKHIDLKQAIIVAPKVASEKLASFDFKQLEILNNGDKTLIDGVSIEAIPMYNLREEALKFHTKGRGNGYVLSLGNQRIYISGDTEDIPEMRNLKDIDIAFVCMNLPWTMPVENAASAVLDFKPKHVYPYHYRGTEGLSDVSKFKDIINAANPNIDVIQLDWYPKLSKNAGKKEQ